MFNTDNKGSEGPFCRRQTCDRRQIVCYFAMSTFNNVGSKKSAKYFNNMVYKHGMQRIVENVRGVINWREKTQ